MTVAYSGGSRITPLVLGVGENADLQQGHFSAKTHVKIAPAADQSKAKIHSFTTE